jgi:CTP:molybdopterin cytidylyltransferase MocA
MRLSFKGVCGSPVIFPYAMKEDLLCYEGEKGGRELLRHDAFGKFEAMNGWELWDADTPESMEKIREVYSSVVTKQECVTS